MIEEELIAELLESNLFSSLEKIPVINSEELHFLQGNENYFEKVTAENKMQVVKDKIKEFFNIVILSKRQETRLKMQTATNMFTKMIWL